MKLLILIGLFTGFHIPLHPATADEKKNYGNKVEIRIGGYLGSRDTDFALSVSDGTANATINIEDDLGIKSDMKVFRAEAIYRLAPKHRLKLGYFRISRSGLRIIDETLNIGDETFDIDLKVQSKFSDSIISFGYTYLFVYDPAWEFGASIGVHLQKNAAEISAVDIVKLVSDSVTLPLPLLGVNGQWNISPRFRLLASGEVFFLKIDNYKGSLYDISLGVEYDITKHFGLGLGFNMIEIDVNSRGNDFEWDYKWRTTGAYAYLKYGF